MQLLHEHTPIMTVKDMCNLRNVSSHNFDVKEKRSSDASLFLMNPVASGDNVAMERNPSQKLKEELPLLPPLVPCCEGKELQINEDLVHSGLSAISVKHDSVIHCLSMSSACERLQVPPGLVKNRNSFRSLHRPDLKRVPYLRRLTPDELEALFRGYADCPQKKSENSKDNQDSRTVHDKVTININDGNGLLRPIPETRSGSGTEDVPAGMRLHGARARLYTSVLAGAKAGDHLENASINEDFDTHVPDDILPEDEIQLHEELQIILPPRCEDITAESSTTNSDNLSIKC